jgi:hypothetical protein
LSSVGKPVVAPAAQQGAVPTSRGWVGDFVLLAVLPIAVVAVATVTAWWTVMRALRSMV